MCNNTADVFPLFGRAMKLFKTFIFTVIITSFLNGCSNFNEIMINLSAGESSHPLKSTKDIEVEKTLASGTWKYQQQLDDCKDTSWEQSFHKNRYYQSIGSACLLLDAFSVEAESWHVKDQNLYIVNLSPSDSDDIIIKYGIDYLDRGKLILSSKGYKYTFLK